MISATDYRGSEETYRRLDTLVARIEATQGLQAEIGEEANDLHVLDKQALEASLPAGMNDEDIAGILHLAMLTECATESYASAIRERAVYFNASWLARFTDRVWVPDELTHHAPYKLMLMDLGFSEEELDRRVKETQEREFVHYGGDTPVHVTTFGMVQEYLTDHWHGLIARLLKRAAPDAAALAMYVKRRETLHMAWYRDMTAIQVEAEPAYAAYMGQEVSRFRMPGNSLVPELQAQAFRWLPMLGADLDRVTRDVIRLLHQVVGSPKNLGSLIVTIAADRGMNIGPLSVNRVEAALNRLGGRGYGLVGEATLEMAGFGNMFKPVNAEAARSLEATPARIRGLLRTWLAGEMSNRIDGFIGVPPPATAKA